MNNLIVNNFLGAVKLIDPRLIEPSMATEAVNCELEAGTIAPIKGLSLTRSLAGTTGSVYFYNGTAYEFTGDCDIVESPVQNSAGRMYFTDGALPKKTNVALHPVTRRLGIQRPVNPISAGGTHLSGTTVVATVSYYYTYVTEWGEESAPSPESAVFEIYNTLSVNLSNFSVPAYSDQAITKKRIYRLAVGTASAEYQFLAEIDAAATTYTDATLTANLGSICPTESWIGPYDDLKGLLYMGNGFMAGYRGNEVYISEPYVPYAWPLSNMFSVMGNIVGLGHYGQRLVVCTDGKPVMLNGVDPRSMSQDNHPESYPCLSKKSIVSMLDCVIYSSNRGLVICSSNGVNLLTAAIWSEEDWTAIGPQNIIGFAHKGRYYGFISGTSKGFIIDFRAFLGGSKYPTVIDLDLGAAVGIIGGCVDTKGDSIYLIVTEGAGRKLYKFSGSPTPLTYSWQSKIFTDVQPDNLGAGFISMNGDANFIYDDGLVTTQPLSNDTLFRLPGSAKSREKQFKVTGTGEITSIQLARNIRSMVSGE